MSLPTNKILADNSAVISEQSMVSGYGQFHTNDYDPDNPTKILTPYVSITLSGIRALVDAPQTIEKKRAQWVIPSTLPNRVFNTQEKHGNFLMLWADLDKEPQPIDRVAEIVTSITHGADYEIYTSSGAKENYQKARVLIPLTSPLNGKDWVLCQTILNNFLEQHGLPTDRRSERAAQICYLPNRGEYYAKISSRDGCHFDPLSHWGAEVERLRESKAAEEEQKRLEAQARSIRAEQHNQEGGNLIDVFNQTYLVEDVLRWAGYKQKKNTFRHPNSESGSYSANVKDGRVYTFSSNDPLYSNGGGAHDAFSAYAVLFHGGSNKEALKEAGDKLILIDGESWNKVQQREYARRLGEDAIKDVDLSNFTVCGKRDVDNEVPAIPTDRPKISSDFEFVSAGELVNAYQPVEYLIDEYIEDQSLFLLFGAPSVGKSFVALSQAACIATGTPWLGRSVRQGAVFYLAGEGQAGIRRRLRAWMLDQNVQLAGAPLFVSKLPASLMNADHAIAVEQAINSLTAQYGEAVLIIIDTLARNLGDGDENSNEDIGLFISHLDKMRYRIGCAIGIVHHSGHAEKDRARGASALPAAVDAIFAMKTEGQARVITQQKAKESEPAKPIAFKLKEVPLGWVDSKDREMTSAVIAEDRIVALKSTLGLKTKNQRLGFKSLCDAINHNLSSVHYDGHWVGVHVDQWRTEFYEVCEATDKKKPFQRVRDDLKKTDLVKCIGDLWYVHESEPNIMIVRLTVNGQGDAGQERDIAGHVPLSHLIEGDRRDTHL